MHFMRALAAGTSLLALSTVVSVNAEEFAQPRSVILIIGDGFDDQHVTMGRNYLVGQAGELTLDTLPYRGAVQIETVNNEGKPLYVADSANTATTLATGVVTHIGRVGTDPDDNDVRTIAEEAEKRGLRTGIVSTASVTDATPAAFMAHVSNRGCEDPAIVLGGTLYRQPYEGCPPDARGNGGPGSIAEQIASAKFDVVLGGGRKFFAVPTPEGGPNAMEQASANGISVATDLESLFAAPKDQPVLGLFAEKHLPVRMRGSDGRIAEAAKTSLLNGIDDRLGSATQPEPMDCEINPAFDGTPSLAMLTELAIDRLSNPRGFFLMVESASIDKQSHARNPCGSIGEVEQLEEALAVALTYAEIHPNTLILVTADHAQAAQIVPEPSLFDDLPVPVYSPGKVARVRTPEGGMMRINYATNNFVSEEHTGANVPLFANAPEGLDLPVYLRQRDLYAIMMDYLQLSAAADTPQ